MDAEADSYAPRISDLQPSPCGDYGLACRPPTIWYMAQGYPVRGGHEAHILHYATEIRRHGFDTRVVVPDPLPVEEHLFIRQLRERGIPLESIADGVALRTNANFAALALPWAVAQMVKGRRPSFEAFRSNLQSRFTASGLREKIERDRPDIIHIFGRLADNLWDVLPVERVVFHHATEGRVDPHWTPEELARFRRFAEAGAVNFAPGRGVADNVRREFGIQRRIEPIFTICPDAAPAELIRKTITPTAAPCKPLRFGIVCRMIEEKGIAHLLEALRLFLARHRDVQFVFAGRGVLEETIDAFVEQHELDSVRRVPEFGSPVEALEQMDVFVHPSTSDAMPMAVAEAIMCARPCIVSRIGGLPDLVRDGVEGFVIEPGSAEAIAAAMERFVEMSSPAFADMCARARARYEDVCAPRQVAVGVAEFYREIVSRNQPDSEGEETTA